MSPIEQELCLPKMKDMQEDLGEENSCWQWLIIMRAFEEVR